MPSDIRSFFGGVPAGSQSKSTSTKEKQKSSPKKPKGSRKIVEDSDDEIPVKKSAAKPSSKPSKRAVSPDGEATTTSDYFATNGKNKPKKTVEVGPKQTPKPSPAKKETPIRHSSRRKSSVVYTEKVLEEDKDDHDDIFEAEYKPNGKGKDDYEESDASASDDAFEVTPSKPARSSKSAKTSKRAPKEDADKENIGLDDDDDDDDLPTKPTRKQATASSKKRKSDGLDEADDDQPAKRSKPAKASPTKKNQKKKADEPENAEMQALFDNIPLVRPPTPPGQNGDGKKWKFGGHANSGPPPAAGSKDIPTGAENCLAGLSFVFTGLLDSIGREEGQNLVKRYGGKIMSAPSSKTSFVVLGNDAGPKKLETIAKFGLRTINEDGLFQLIRTLPANGGDSKAAAKYEEKAQAEEAKAREDAAAIDEEEKKKAKAQAKAFAPGDASGAKANGKEKVIALDSRLWTTKYAPHDMRSICGNKGQVEKLQRWLAGFQKAQKKNFKAPGPEGLGLQRAVMIHGPPGIGKTTAAHLVAKLEGYDVVESNASDTRSKKLIEAGLRGVLSTTSLLGYFAADGKDVENSKKKLLLIMDEVDGMSGGDRGGVGAMAAVCKKTQIPIILICNDKRQPKMKPFQFCTYDLPFRRPTTEMIRSRLKTISFREGLNLPNNVLDALIEGTGADIRQVINMLSTAKLDDSSMDYDKSKKMSKAWQKHIVLKPWDIIGRVLGGGLFAPTSTATLNDKIELYFNDHDISYLMLQENYLGTTPQEASKLQGHERSLKHLEMVENAASSISDADLVDRMIHGQDQQWSLMPTHAVFGFVRPASFVAGSMSGHGGARFPEWLGKNSSQGKFLRQIKEIQGHMRLRAAADRHEVRQLYVPLLWQQLVKRLESEGKEGVQSVIDIMDSYFLTKEDWDAILELGIGYMDESKVSLDTQTKATFTRLYNQQSHPMPFMKASNVVVPKNAVKVKPDLEEALDESDGEAVVDDIKEEAEDEDNPANAEAALQKDKYIKPAKQRKAPAKSAAKRKRKAGDEEDVEGSDVDTAPKKSRGGASSSAKGKSNAKAARA